MHIYLSNKTFKNIVIFKSFIYFIYYIISLFLRYLFPILKYYNVFLILRVQPVFKYKNV